MLVVETIAKIRLAYFSRKKTIKAICRVWGRSRNGKNMVRQVTAKSRFARAVAAVNLGWRQRMAFQDFVEARPADDALAISPRQPLLPYPHDLTRVPAQSSSIATNAVISEVTPHH